MRLVLALLLVLSFPARAQEAELSAWRQSLPEAAQVGFVLVRTSDRKVLASCQPGLGMVPASTMKVISAAAILERLGPQRRLVTRLLASGEDLILQGGGDPELSHQELEAMAAAPLGPGLRRLVVDSRAVGGLPLGPGWAWDDVTEDYSAEITGLTVDRGQARVRIVPGPVGSPPLCSDLTVNATTVEGPGSWSLVRLPGRPGTFLVGQVPAGPALECSLSVVDPDLYAAGLLRQALRRRGVELGEPVRGASPEGAAVLAEHASRPVEEILRQALAVSDNLVMETLYRLAGSPPTRALRNVDGSGLSRYNLVRAQDLVDTLLSCPALRDLLPEPGAPGTLADRFQGGMAFGVVRAKTGTMTGVSGLAGYLFPGQSDRECVFALLVNGYPRPMRECKRAEDALIEALVKRIGSPYL